MYCEFLLHTGFFIVYSKLMGRTLQGKVNRETACVAVKRIAKQFQILTWQNPVLPHLSVIHSTDSIACPPLPHPVIHSTGSI